MISLCFNIEEMATASHAFGFKALGRASRSKAGELRRCSCVSRGMNAYDSAVLIMGSTSKGQGVAKGRVAFIVRWRKG